MQVAIKTSSTVLATTEIKEDIKSTIVLCYGIFHTQ